MASKCRTSDWRDEGPCTDRSDHPTGQPVSTQGGQAAREPSEHAVPVRPHVRPREAREDTILFPAFRKIVSEHEYDALGEEFEKKENQLFHDDGFEKNVNAVAKLEKELGIYDLAQFTPTV